MEISPYTFSGKQIPKDGAHFVLEWIEVPPCPLTGCRPLVQAQQSLNHRTVYVGKDLLDHPIIIHWQVCHWIMAIISTPTHLSDTTRHGDSITSLGSLVQCLTILFIKKFFLISNLNHLWPSLRLSPLVLFLAAWEERLETCLTNSFQVVIKRNEVFPQPPLLQTT